MGPTVERLKAMTGMHEFAEFTSEDVGSGRRVDRVGHAPAALRCPAFPARSVLPARTAAGWSCPICGAGWEAALAPTHASRADRAGTIDSGLNSIVLASNDERVLLPINEPTYGTPRRSQIQTYLEQHGGAPRPVAKAHVCGGRVRPWSPSRSPSSETASPRMCAGQSYRMRCGRRGVAHPVERGERWARGARRWSALRCAPRYSSCLHRRGGAAHCPIHDGHLCDD